MDTDEYLVRARLDNMVMGEHFYADDDRHAMFQAIQIVLNNATKSEAWARGSIVVTNHEHKVLYTMDAK
jgi:hypothetical protein